MKPIHFVLLLFAIALCVSETDAQWVHTNGPEGGGIFCFAVSGTSLFAGTSGGIFLSTDNGTCWTAVNSGLTRSFIRASAVSGTNLFAGTSGGVFLSTNIGTSWTAVDSGLTNPYVDAFAVSGTNLFAGTLGSGVFRSTDNGSSWKYAGMPNCYVISLAVSGTTLVGGTAYGGGAFVSTNDGISWTPFNTGLPNTTVWSLAIIDTNVFAGTNGVGVWRRPLSGMVGSIGESVAKIPALFELEQNYPNPFNPSTTIRYGLPQRSHMILTVFNTLGQQVALLQNGEQEAGYHEVKFDGSGLSSGVYFYRIEAGSFVQTRKLLLLILARECSDGYCPVRTCLRGEPASCGWSIFLLGLDCSKSPQDQACFSHFCGPQ